jgi:hypothetical protein
MNANGLYNGLEGYIVPGTNSGMGMGVANGVVASERMSNDYSDVSLLFNLDFKKSSFGGNNKIFDLVNRVEGDIIGSYTYNSVNTESIRLTGGRCDMLSSVSYKPQFPITASIMFRANSLAALAFLFKTDNPINGFHSGVDISITSTSINISYGNNTANLPSGRRTYTATYSFSANQWYVVDVVFINNLECIGYINGNRMPTFTITGSATSLVYAGSRMSIGYRYDSGVNYLFDGSITYLRIYNRALSQGEVVKNYLFTKSRYNI